MNPVEKIQRAWQTREPHLPSRALTFASAIWQVALPRTSHDAALDLLPEFIEAEMEHATNVPKFVAVKRHLLICPSCATIYFDLLETAQLDAQRKLTQPLSKPRPALDFLNSADTGE